MLFVQVPSTMEYFVSWPGRVEPNNVFERRIQILPLRLTDNVHLTPTVLEESGHKHGFLPS